MINDVKDFHLPRYEELPDLEIYMDQVLQLLNNISIQLFKQISQKQ